MSQLSWKNKDKSPQCIIENGLYAAQGSRGLYIAKFMGLKAKTGASEWKLYISQGEIEFSMDFHSFSGCKTAAQLCEDTPGWAVKMFNDLK